MRYSNLFWGVALILFGALMLFDKLQLFWPIVLIVMGLWIVVGGRWGAAQKDKTVSLDMQSARSVRVRIGFGAGQLRIDGAAAAGKALDGTINEDALAECKLDGDALNIRLRHEGAFNAFPMVRNGYRWNLHLTKEIPLTLDMDTGASSSTVDLSALRVSTLSLNTGASETDLTFPAAGHTSAQVHAGAAEIRLRVPQGVAARIRSRSGLAEVRVDSSRFPRLGDVNQSPDFETAANRIDLLIEVGAASVRVL